MTRLFITVKCEQCNKPYKDIADLFMDAKTRRTIVHGICFSCSFDNWKRENKKNKNLFGDT